MRSARMPATSGSIRPPRISAATCRSKSASSATRKPREKFEAENEAMYKQVLGYTDAVHPAVIGKVLSDFLYKGNMPKDRILVGSGGFGIARYTRRWLRAYRPAQIMNGQYQFGTVGADVGYAVGTGIAV